MSWHEWLGGLMILLGTGGALIILAELLCGMIDLPRRTPDAETAESEADAEFRRICEEVEAEAAKAAKQCGPRRRQS